VNFMYKIGGITDTHEGTSGIYIVLPAIELLVTFESEVISFFFRFEEKAVGFKIRSFDIGDIT